MEATQILSGVGYLYIAEVGTAFPALNAEPGASWTPLGETQDGVTVTLDQDIEEVTVDQRTGPVKAIRTGETAKIETKLALATLENMAVVLGRDVITVEPGAGAIGTKAVSLYRGGSVKEFALLFRCTSPYGEGFPGQYEVPRCYLGDTLEIEYTKDGNVVIPVVFNLLEDLSATSESQRFGRLYVKYANATS